MKAAAQELGVREETLRRWEQAGKFTSERTAGSHRRYDLATLRFVADNRERRSLNPMLARLLAGPARLCKIAVRFSIIANAACAN